MNLVNNIDVARVDGSTANFSGSGKGNNQIGALDAKHGSTLNFSQLQNLVNQVDVARVQGSKANFDGSGKGNNQIGALDASKGSTLNFSQLLLIWSINTDINKNSNSRLSQVKGPAIREKFIIHLIHWITQDFFLFVHLRKYYKYSLFMNSSHL